MLGERNPRFKKTLKFLDYQQIIRPGELLVATFILIFYLFLH
jgi:hypothetical protein